MDASSHSRDFPCRFCQAPLTTTFVDLGMSPLCQTHIEPDQLQRDGAVLPAARATSATSASWCSSQEYVAPDEIFTRVRVLLLVLVDSWVEHARRYAEMMIGALRPGPDEPGGRGRQQRRLPAAALRRSGASRSSASSRRPTSPRRPIEKGIPTDRPVLRRRETAARARCRARPRRPAARQQRAGPRARHQRLRRRASKLLLAPGGVITMEFPHLLRLMDENQFDTIYHEHFSLSVLHDGRDASSPTTG